MYRNQDNNPMGTNYPNNNNLQNERKQYLGEAPPSASQNIASQLQQLRNEIAQQNSSQESGVKDMFNLKAASYMLGDVEKWLSESNDRKQGKSALQQFGAAMKGEFNDPDTYALGTFEAANGLNLLSLARKAEKEGVQLSPAEQLALRAAALRTSASNELDSQQTFAQKLGGGLVETIPYIAQFALTGGLGGAASTAAKGATTRALASTAGKGGIAAATAATLPKAAGVAANVGARTLAQPSTYADIAERKLGDIAYTTDAEGNIAYDGTEGESDWVASINKGLMAGAINNSTEMLGAGLTKGVTAVGKQVNQRIINSLSPSLQNTLNKLPNNGLGGWVTNIAERAGYNGMVQEFVEEQPATLLNAIFVGDNELSDLLDPQQQTLTALGAIAYGSAFKGLDLATKDATIALAQSRVRKSKDTLRQQLAADKSVNPKEAELMIDVIADSKSLELLAQVLNGMWHTNSKNIKKPHLTYCINDFAAQKARLLAIERKGDYLYGKQSYNPMHSSELATKELNPYLPSTKLEKPDDFKKLPSQREQYTTPYGELEQYDTRQLKRDNSPKVGENPSTEPLSIEQRREVVEDLAKKLNLDNVEIYDFQLETYDPNLIRMYGNGVNIHGMYKTSTDKIKMILEHALNERELVKTMLHEAIGHRGVINMFPNGGKEFLTEVYDSMSDYDKLRYKKKNGEKKRAVKEYVADLSEGLVDSPSKWQTFCAKFRSNLRQAGVNIRLSDNDIHFILRDVRDTSTNRYINPTYTIWGDKK